MFINRQLEAHSETVHASVCRDAQFCYAWSGEVSFEWQLIEDRNDDRMDASKQLVWSPVYVNALLLQDTDTNADGDFEDSGERLYVTADATFNVTMIAGFDSGWAPVQRMVYDSYGNVHFFNADWSEGENTVEAKYLFQGGRYDAATGLYVFQRRDYSPTMMRWIQEDPLGYVDGMNWYQGFGDNPIAGRFGIVQWISAIHKSSHLPSTRSDEPSIVNKTHVRWLSLNLGANAIALGVCCLASFGLISVFQAQNGVECLSVTPHARLYQMIVETIPGLIGSAVTFLSAVLFCIKLWKKCIPLVLCPFLLLWPSNGTHSPSLWAVFPFGLFSKRANGDADRR